MMGAGMAGVDGGRDAPSAARPDLSGLPLETRFRIACAEAEGAAWGRGLGNWRILAKPIEATAPRWVYIITEDASGEGPGSSLPDYANDPAVWGPVLETMGGFETVRHNGRRALLVWHEEVRPDLRRRGARSMRGTLGPTLGLATMLAHLQRAGRDIAEFLSLVEAPDA